MASAEFDENSAEKEAGGSSRRPFMEKLLLEACLEVMKDRALNRHQDRAQRAHMLNLRDGIARRRPSESTCASTAARDREDGVRNHALGMQERMLLVVKTRRERASRDFREVGCTPRNRRSHDDGLMRVRERGTVVAEIPPVR